MGTPTLRLSVLAFVLVCIVALAQTGPGRSVLNALGLRGAPAHYTELSFSSPRALPFNFVRGGLLHLDFDIHNVEGELRVYTWQIELTPEAGAAQLADHGAALIDRGATQHVATAVRVPCAGTTERVTIQLGRPALRLSFAGHCLGPAPGTRGR